MVVGPYFCKFVVVGGVGSGRERKSRRGGGAAGKYWADQGQYLTCSRVEGAAVVVVVVLRRSCYLLSSGKDFRLLGVVPR